MGTFEKCFLCIVYSILITIPQTKLIFLPLSPLFWRQEPQLCCPGWSQILDSSGSFFPSQVPRTGAPHYHAVTNCPLQKGRSHAVQRPFNLPRSQLVTFRGEQDANSGHLHPCPPPPVTMTLLYPGKVENSCPDSSKGHKASPATGVTLAPVEMRRHDEGERLSVGALRPTTRVWRCS